MYSLKIWTNPRNEADVRVYINGTTRSALYFTQGDNGRVVWSSKTNDTPHRFQTGDHYGKVAKDRAAADRVAIAYQITLGPKGPEGEWERLLKIAADGIEVED